RQDPAWVPPRVGSMTCGPQKRVRVTLILGVWSVACPSPHVLTRRSGDVHRKAAPKQLGSHRVQQLAVACIPGIAGEAVSQPVSRLQVLVGIEPLQGSLSGLS